MLDPKEVQSLFEYVDTYNVYRGCNNLILWRALNFRSSLLIAFVVFLCVCILNLWLTFGSLKNCHVSTFTNASLHAIVDENIWLILTKSCVTEIIPKLIRPI